MTEKELSQEEIEIKNETNVDEVEELVEEQQVDDVQNEEKLQVDIEELQKVKADLEKKLEESESRILRLQADFENSRRRARLDLEAVEKYKAQKLITELLPAIDNFERALQMNLSNDQESSLLQGMEMVYRSIIEALKKEGAEQIEAVGTEFDPNLHQAIMQVEDSNYASNVVVEELQKGYILKDRVIRPSMVKVNK